MNYIFLDWDGVMLSGHYLYTRPEPHQNYPQRYIDPEAVKRLNRITDATGAMIVISSTKRMEFNLQELREIFGEAGVTAIIKDVTPKMYQQRGVEIQTWLDACADDFDRFVILDDDSDMGDLMPFLVKTQFMDGLQDEHVEQAVNLINLGHK